MKPRLHGDELAEPPSPSFSGLWLNQQIFIRAWTSVWSGAAMLLWLPWRDPPLLPHPDAAAVEGGSNVPSWHSAFSCSPSNTSSGLSAPSLEAGVRRRDERKPSLSLLQQLPHLDEETRNTVSWALWSRWTSEYFILNTAGSFIMDSCEAVWGGGNTHTGVYQEWCQQLIRVGLF